MAINAGGLFAVPWLGADAAAAVAQKTQNPRVCWEKAKFCPPVEWKDGRFMIQRAESGARSRHVIF
jgi:hypothetical protein